MIALLHIKHKYPFKIETSELVYLTSFLGDWFTGQYGKDLNWGGNTNSKEKLGLIKMKLNLD